MTCHHSPGDPRCGSNTAYFTAPLTPDAERYEVLDAVQCGSRMVLKVQYPNCKSCAYEGVKVLVYDNVTPIDVIRWRRIDPHFSDSSTRTPKEAPPPMARFPASQAGWIQAVWFANFHKP